MEAPQRPNSADAEAALLGAALIDPDVAKRYRDALQPQDFYYEPNQNLWRVIQGLAKRGQQADSISIEAALGERRFIEYGGDGWIANLTLIPSALNAETYVNIVQTHAERRRIIGACEAIVKQAWSDTPIADVRALTIKATGEALGTHGATVRHQRTVLDELLKRLEMIDAGELDPRGISTGLADLDRLTDGLFKGELTIIGARPGMGKSGLLATMCDNISRRQRRRVLVFSLEMTDTTWAGRVLSQVAGVDSRKIIRLGGLDADEWQRVIEQSKGLNDAPLWIDDTRGLTDLDIRTRTRQVAADVGGLDIVVVDHLTLMKSSRHMDRYSREVGSNVLSLREMAAEINCHVLAAAQLNRKLEERADKHPSLSDFKETGEIEEHSDNVWSLYRDEYYDRDTDKKGIADVDALKGRNGLTGRVELAYDPVKQRFANLLRTQL